MKKFILFLVIVLLFFIFYGRKADIGKEQQEFEATIDNFKKAVDNVPAEIKRRKKAANNEYAEKKIESQESVLRDRVYSGVSVFRSRVTPAKKFAGLVTGVDGNGIVVVKHRNTSYSLKMPSGFENRISLISSRDKVTFSGVIDGTELVTNAEFLEKPLWKVTVSEFDDSAVEEREKKLDSCIIKAGMALEEICDRLVQFNKLQEKINDNQRAMSYYGEIIDIPSVINVRNFVVEFKEIEDVENLPDAAYRMLNSASIVSNIIGGIIGFKDGVQTISYIAKSHGVTFRMPLYAGRVAFKSDKEKKELNALKARFAEDNFKKGNSLRLTGQVSWKPQDDDPLVMVVSPGFVLKE